MNGFLKTKRCTDSCPDKCSSNDWEVFNDKDQRWEENQLVHIDCGKHGPIQISALGVII